MGGRMMCLNHAAPGTIYSQEDFAGKIDFDGPVEFQVKRSALPGYTRYRYGLAPGNYHFASIADLSSHFGVQRRSVDNRKRLVLLRDDPDQLRLGFVTVKTNKLG